MNKTISGIELKNIFFIMLLLLLFIWIDNTKVKQRDNSFGWHI